MSTIMAAARGESAGDLPHSLGHGICMKALAHLECDLDADYLHEILAEPPLSACTPCGRCVASGGRVLVSLADRGLGTL